MNNIVRCKFLGNYSRKHPDCDSNTIQDVVVHYQGKIESKLSGVESIPFSMDIAHIYAVMVTEELASSLQGSQLRFVAATVRPRCYLTVALKDQRVHTSKGSEESSKLIHQVTFIFDKTTTAPIFCLQGHLGKSVSFSFLHLKRQ